MLTPVSDIATIEIIPEHPSTLPLVPEGCLFCGAKWRGGCQVPGEPFPKVGVRVFYRCGASLSVCADLGDGSVYLSARSCLDVEKIQIPF